MEYNSSFIRTLHTPRFFANKDVWSVPGSSSIMTFGFLLTEVTLMGAIRTLVSDARGNLHCEHDYRRWDNAGRVGK